VRLPGGAGDVGGDDVGSVPVQAAAGPLWWTQVSELSECLSLAVLSPEDRDRVAVDLAQQVADVG
jgi:hypothetical protein